MSDGAVLAAQNITRRFGDFVALESVDFAVGEGEIVALLGENGAGKSTLMNILSGALAPSGGTVLMDGSAVRFGSPLDATSRGIGMVHQHFRLVPTVSVAENLLLSAPRRAGGAFSYPLKLVLHEAKILAGRLGWTIAWDTNAGDLPVGMQQRVEILKALRGQTRVLILDEPTAVLSPTETPELFATIRRLADVGHGIVFISHKLEEVMALSHRVCVLRRGRVVFQDVTASVSETVLAQAMVGAESDAATLLLSPSPPRPLSPRGVEKGGVRVPELTGFAGSPTMAVPETPPFSTPRGERGRGGEGEIEVRGVSVRRAGTKKPLLDDISFTVAPGEVFGVAGVDGNGQEELAAVLSGILRPSAGVVTVGQASPAANAAAFRRAGVAVIPADRQARGLAMPLTLAENVALGVYDAPEYRAGFLLRWRKLKTHAANLVTQFDIRGTTERGAVRSLSGGNQQKVVIARALSGNPRVIIAVNPTRGLDVGAIAYVHNALRVAQNGGAAIVLISTELTEITRLATSRVAVLFDGRFTGIVAPDAPRETFGLLMGGKTESAKRA